MQHLLFVFLYCKGQKQTNVNSALVLYKCRRMGCLATCPSGVLLSTELTLLVRHPVYLERQTCNAL